MVKGLHLVVLVLVAILFAGNTYAESNIKIGVDFMGKHKVTINGISAEEDVKTGVSLSGEYIQAINPNVGIGGGITFQIPRSQEDYEGNFKFIPLYGLVKIHSNYEYQAVNFYLLGQLGYNAFMGDNDYKGFGTLTGGLYYGIGTGIIFNKNNQIELLYSVNNGSYSISGWSGSFDVEYSKITVSYGYAF